MVLLPAVLLRGYWYPVVGSLLAFLGANAATISGLNSALGIIIWPLELILVVAGLYGLRKNYKPQAQINVEQTAYRQGQNLISQRDINQQVTNYYPAPQPHDATEQSRNAHGLLPPAPGRLEGRERELAHLKAALGLSAPTAEDDATAQERTGVTPRHPSAPVVAVHGWPGVGKSALVGRLCHDQEILEHFGGRIYFVPLGPAPDTRHIAEQLCSNLGVKVDPGASLQDLRGALSGALSRERALLILDDVWEHGNVAPLLVGGECATLVVSRRLDLATQLASAPEGAIKLDLLSEEQSLRLLRSRAPEVVENHAEGCLELVRTLDGLPLALRVAADLLRVEEHSGFEVSGLIGEMTQAARVLHEQIPHDVHSADSEDQARSLRTVRALLDKSLERMDEKAVERFAELGVLPPKPFSFDPWAAEDMWRESAEDPELADHQREEEPERTTDDNHEFTRNALRELVRRGLVEVVETEADSVAGRLDLRSGRPERFWMHSLVAAFAADTLGQRYGEAAVKEAQKRRLEHYRRVVAAANGAMDKGGDWQYLGAYLFSLDLPNIRAAHEWARQQSSQDPYCLEYLSRLLQHGGWILGHRLGPGEFLNWVRLAEEAARELGDAQALDDHLHNLVAALLRNGRTDEAAAYCERVLNDSPGNEDTTEEAAALTNSAVIYRRWRDYQTALDYARRGERAAVACDSPNTAAGAIGEQAQCFKSLEQIESAEERLEAKRDFSLAEGEQSRYAEALTDLAIIRRDWPAQRDEAREYFEAAARIFSDLREHADYRRTQIGLGILEAEAGELDAAEVAFSRALDSAIDSEDSVERGRAKMHLGIAYRYRNTEEWIDAAESAFTEARGLVGDADWELQGDVLLNLAMLLRDYRSGSSEARDLAQEAQSWYESVGSSKLSVAQKVLGEL